MQSKGKIIGIAIAIAIAVSILAYYTSSTIQPVNTQLVTVNIAYNNFIDSLPFFVAEDKGYFNDSNINVVGMSEQDASLVTSAILAGHADVGLPVAITDVLILQEKEPGNLKYFLSAEETKNNNSQIAILVKNDSAISSLGELKGKKLGILPGSFSIIVAKMMLKNYFDPTKVQFVTLSPTDFLNALSSGQVDALYSVEPLNTIAIQSGVAKSIMNSANANTIHDPFPAVGYAFSTKFVNEHPQTAAKIIDIMNKAIDYMNANPDGARTILAKHTGLPPDLVKNLGWSKYVDASSSISDIQVIADKMYQEKDLDVPINVTSIIYSP